MLPDMGIITCIIVPGDDPNETMPPLTGPVPVISSLLVEENFLRVYVPDEA